MTKYTVQFTMPVDNPEKNVSVTKRKGCLTFELPINYPDAHKMNLSDLIAAAELSGLVNLSTPHNKNRISVLQKKV